MAPFIAPGDPNTRAVGFSSGFRPLTTNGPEVIEIDDDDDESNFAGSMEEEELEEGDDDDQEEQEESGDGDDAGEEEEDDDDEDDVLPDEEDSQQVNGTDTSVLDDSSLSSETTNQQVNLTMPELFTPGSVQQALNPLRHTAERVTRQIEAFAEKLDQFKQKATRADSFNKIQAAWALVRGYRAISEDALAEVSKQHNLKRAKTGWKQGAGSTSPARAPDEVVEAEMTRLRLEADTWLLLEDLLSSEDPNRQVKETQAQEQAFQRLHRYSSDREIWDTFIDADAYAHECLVIMDWLERTARSSEHEVDALISDLESQAERGSGLWAHGWLYTKESIKGQKRLRAWPQPLEPSDPGITLSLLSSEKKKPLITQLDPDAILRQKQGLQKEDTFYERATWLTCWKMLRHGEDWTKIRDWAQSRLEGWRAISLCGTSIGSKSQDDRRTSKTRLANGTATRMMSFHSQPAWGAACLALARNPNTDEFERAVYGLLCGETEAAFKICRNWEDHLYVFFNSILLSRYRGFCKQLQRKISHHSSAPSTSALASASSSSPSFSTVRFVPEAPAYQDVRHFLELAGDNERIGVEARNPFRAIQATIFSHSYDSYFASMAQAVCKSNSNRPERAALLPKLAPWTVDESMLNAAQDEDCLRIAAHLYIVASILNYVRSDTQFRETASTVLLGYMAYLEDASIFDHMPLYATLLPSQIVPRVLGQFLLDIVDFGGRTRQIKAMKRHSIDIEAALDDQWDWLYHQVPEIKQPRPIKAHSKILREKDADPKLLPVTSDFIGPHDSARDEHLIRSIEWRRYIKGQWDRICHLGALLYREFYVSGKLGAARELMRRMNLSEISQEAFGVDLAALSTGVEAASLGAAAQDITSPGSGVAVHSRSSSQNLILGSSQSILHQQSALMRDLEQLIVAFDALEAFALALDKFNQHDGSRNRKSTAYRDLETALKTALGNLSASVDPIIGLTRPELTVHKWLPPTGKDPVDADLHSIRTLYVPQLVLEYHSALYFAAHALSSEILLDCPNLAIRVASDPMLTAAFQDSRRMRELVDALALSSKAMTMVSHKNRKKRFATGETLSIWDVEIQTDLDEELSDVK